MTRAVVLLAMLAGITSVAARGEPGWRQPFDPVRSVGHIDHVTQLQRHQRH
jgi:hypothetical protein